MRPRSSNGRTSANLYSPRAACTSTHDAAWSMQGVLLVALHEVKYIQASIRVQQSHTTDQAFGCSLKFTTVSHPETDKKSYLRGPSHFPLQQWPSEPTRQHRQGESGNSSPNTFRVAATASSSLLGRMSALYITAIDRSQRWWYIKCPLVSCLRSCMCISASPKTLHHLWGRQEKAALKVNRPKMPLPTP